MIETFDWTLVALWTGVCDHLVRVHVAFPWDLCSSKEFSEFEQTVHIHCLYNHNAFVKSMPETVAACSSKIQMYYSYKSNTMKISRKSSLNFNQNERHFSNLVTKNEWQINQMNKWHF